MSLLPGLQQPATPLEAIQGGHHTWGIVYFSIKKIDKQLHHLLRDITAIDTTTCRLNTNLGQYSWPGTGGMEAAGWDGGRREADTFLVASEPCQEAQQV